MRSIRQIHILIVLCGIVAHCSYAAAEEISLSQDANGWTQFSPSADSDVVYISVADGNDGTCQSYRTADGVWEVSGTPFEPDAGEVVPCATWATALGKTATGGPDWILFKRGETFTQSADMAEIERSGKSASEPFLVSNYGASGAIPVLDLQSYHGLYFNFASSYVAVTGLDFYNSVRDPDNGGSYDPIGDYGIRFYYVGPSGQDRPATGVLIEGCTFRFNRYGGVYISSTSTGTNDGIVVRRNLFKYTSFGIQSNRTDGMRVEENIFYHCGWWDVSGQTEHSIYSQGDRNLIIRKNVSINPASIHWKLTNPYYAEIGKLHGIVVDNNLMVDGEIGIGAGHNFRQSNYPYRIGNLLSTNNVMTHMGAQDARSPQVHISWGLNLAGLDSGLAANNIVLNQLVATVVNVRGLHIEGDCRNSIFRDNVFYNLEYGSSAYGQVLLENISSDSNTGNTIKDNDIQVNANGGLVINHDYQIAPGEINFSNNRYYAAVSDGNRFKINSSLQTDAQWATATGDNSTFTQVSYPDNTRDVDTYMTSISETPATVPGFVALVLAQGWKNWNPLLEADAVNDWIRAGFGLSEYSAAASIPIGSGQATIPLTGGNSSLVLQ